MLRGGQPSGTGIRARLVALRREWLPRLSRRCERDAVTAVFLALALVVAPLSASIRAVCDQCPADCPMHQPAAAKQGKPSCHATRGGGHGEHASGSALGPSLARPPCSHSGIIPGVALAPMILPDAVRSRFVVLSAKLRQRPLPLHARSNDPPEPRPPIVSA